MTTILARKKNGKKCQSVTGFKNVEGVLSKRLKVGLEQCAWLLGWYSIIQLVSSVLKVWTPKWLSKHYVWYSVPHPNDHLCLVLYA